MARPQLLLQLAAAQAARAVLVSAPAGFGKTTVLRQHFAQLRDAGGIAIWITADDADNDIDRFILGLSQAIAPLASDPTGHRGTGSEGTAATSDIALEVMNRIAWCEQPFRLFLDDAEMIRNRTVLDFLRQVIDHLPPNGQLLVGSRSVPDIGLNRLRARGELFELHAGVLSFTVEESARFLRQLRGLALRDEQVLALHLLTKGWPTALWLVSLSLHDRDNPQALIDSFGGEDVNLADYLLDDVLARQPEAVRQFLMKTSVLRDLNTALCDHLLGRDDSRAMLADIEQSNLFLESRDASRRSFQYHALFRSFLLTQLRQAFPGEETRLHLRASAWYMRNNQPVFAIDHALRSGDVEYALSLLATHAEDLLWKGRARLLARWFDSPMIAGQLPAWPQMNFVRAWALLLVNRTRDSRLVLDQLRACADREGGTAAPPEELLDALDLSLRRWEDDAWCEDDAAWRACLARLAPVKGFYHGMVNVAFANILIAENRFVDARACLDAALAEHRQSGSAFMMVAATCLVGSIELIQGRPRDAASYCRAASTGSAGDFSRFLPGSTVSAAFLAEALYELDELDEAGKLLKVYLPLIKEVLPADQIITSYLLLSRIARSSCRYAEADELLAEMENFGHHRGLSRVCASARLERCRIALMQGHFSAAEEFLQSALLDRRLKASGALSVGHANDVDSPMLARMRLDIRAGRHRMAIAPLKEALRQAIAAHRMRRQLRIRILLAEALHNDGQKKAALRQLREALQFAADQGFVRAFLEEGAPILRLVAELRSASPAASDSDAEDDAITAFADRLLAVAGIAQPAAAADAPGECPVDAAASALTDKELRVLALLGRGMSNKAIAEKLFVAETTVKAHLRKINAKLQADNRTQAVAIARRKGIVS